MVFAKKLKAHVSRRPDLVLVGTNRLRIHSGKPFGTDADETDNCSSFGQAVF